MNKVYGYTAIHSDGWFMCANPMDNGESRTYLYSHQDKCLEAAYEDYIEVYQNFVEDDEMIDTRMEAKEEFFQNVKENNMAGYIQLPDCHIQFEFFEKEVL